MDGCAPPEPGYGAMGAAAGGGDSGAAAGPEGCRQVRYAINAMLERQLCIAYDLSKGGIKDRGRNSTIEESALPTTPPRGQNHKSAAKKAAEEAAKVEKSTRKEGRDAAKAAKERAAAEKAAKYTE